MPGGFLLMAFILKFMTVLDGEVSRCMTVFYGWRCVCSVSC